MADTVRIAVVADDLTGALDAVGPFAEAGLRCIVTVLPEQLDAAMESDAVVMGVSTNSRDLQPAEAAAVVRSLAERLRAVPLIFKKVDSRLKGNIAAEVSALALGLGLRDVVLCPAIPAMGRVVVQGRLQGFGVAGSLDVTAVLAGEVGLTVTVPDARTDTEIDALLAELTPGTLLAGARGLSAGLARAMAIAASAPVTLPLPLPIAFAIGSRDPITTAQVADLKLTRPDALYCAAPNGLFEGNVTGTDVAIMQAVPGENQAEPQAVTRALARGFVEYLVPGRACLVLTGGETAAAVLAEIGITQLQVLGEVLPGLPLCCALDFPGAPLIVAKSGGFGGAETLSQLLRATPRKNEGAE